MIKRFEVKAELFMSADRVESVVVKANTERKAIEFAKEQFRKKHKNISDMITVLSVKEI